MSSVDPDRGRPDPRTGLELIRHLHTGDGDAFTVAFAEYVLRAKLAVSDSALEILTSAVGAARRSST